VFELKKRKKPAHNNASTAFGSETRRISANTNNESNFASAFRQLSEAEQRERLKKMQPKCQHRREARRWESGETTLCQSRISCTDTNSHQSCPNASNWASTIWQAHWRSCEQPKFKWSISCSTFQCWLPDNQCWFLTTNAIIQLSDGRTKFTFFVTKQVIWMVEKEAFTIFGSCRHKQKKTSWRCQKKPRKCLTTANCCSITIASQSSQLSVASLSLLFAVVFLMVGAAKHWKQLAVLQGQHLMSHLSDVKTNNTIKTTLELAVQHALTNPWWLPKVNDDCPLSPRQLQLTSVCDMVCFLIFCHVISTSKTKRWHLCFCSGANWHKMHMLSAQFLTRENECTACFSATRSTFAKLEKQTIQLLFTTLLLCSPNNPKICDLPVTASIPECPVGVLS